MSGSWLKFAERCKDKVEPHSSVVLFQCRGPWIRAYLHYHIIRVCECASIELIDWPLRSFPKSKYVYVCFTDSHFSHSFEILWQNAQGVEWLSQIERNGARLCAWEWEGASTKCTRQKERFFWMLLLLLLLLIWEERKIYAPAGLTTWLADQQNQIKSNISTILYLWWNRFRHNKRVSEKEWYICRQTDRDRGRERKRAVLNSEKMFCRHKLNRGIHLEENMNKNKTKAKNSKTVPKCIEIKSLMKKQPATTSTTKEQITTKTLTCK